MSNATDSNTTTATQPAEPAKKPVKMVTIKIPIDRQNKGDVFVSVNDRTFLIQRGKNVKVPEYVAEVLKHRDDMLAEAMEFEASIATD